VDKAPGVASQATPSGDVGTLPWLVARHLAIPISQVHTVHRLDRETSGIVVFGKTAAATRALAAAFREGTAHKEYLAVVAGRQDTHAVRREQGDRHAIGMDHRRRKRAAGGGVPDAGGSIAAGRHYTPAVRTELGMKDHAAMGDRVIHVVQKDRRRPHDRQVPGPGPRPAPAANRHC
jgi:hypothetical protein